MGEPRAGDADIDTLTPEKVPGAETQSLTSEEPTSITIPTSLGDASATADPGVELVTLPWGSGEGQVGLQAPTEGLARGPEALAVAPDGRIAILDEVNSRVVMLDAAGRYQGTAKIDLCAPRFLAVDNDRLYVLDADVDHRLLVLDWSGTFVSAYALPELSDPVTALLATEVGPCLELAHAQVYLVGQAPVQQATGPGAAGTLAAESAASLIGQANPGQANPGSKPSVFTAKLRALPGRPLTRDLSRLADVRFMPSLSAQSSSLSAQSTSGKAGTATFQVKLSKADKSLKSSELANLRPQLGTGYAIEHLVSVDGDSNQGLVVGARLLQTNASADRTKAGQPALLVARLVPRASSANADTTNKANTADELTDFETTNTLLLSDTTWAYVGVPYVVAPDGRIFQPVATRDGYRVMVHTFSPVTSTPAMQGGN
ncbi:MAG: hypothetical protein H5T84_08085 [Thermoleophilia bacterium]|nr:hypothetical protein [Thermoleophilia bacterium]